MRTTLQRLWTEDDGFVLSSEMVLYGTVGVLGVGAGYTALRDSVNSELDDVAKALGSIDQSYFLSPVVGHSAWTAGSAYFDRADFCDHTYQPQVVVPQCDRPVVCADVFGRGAYVPTTLPPAIPQPEVDSLPTRGAAVAPAHSHVVPQPSAVRAVVPAPSKGVYIEPAPAYVLGSPALVPAPYCQGNPVNVMVDPWRTGPYLVDVPEGYFNHGPGRFANLPNYRVYVEGQSGPCDYGYCYAPQPTAAAAPVTWDTIDLGFAKVGDDELKQVEKFSKAKCLHVLGSNVTDKGLGYIADMDQLESLHLVGTQVTDAGLKQLVGMKKLRFLHLVGTKITDKGLASLAGMKQLEELDVRGTPVTDVGLGELQKVLPALRVIR